MQTHFWSVPHESSSHSMGCEHIRHCRDRLSVSSLLPTFSDDPEHGLLVSCLEESKHLCQADLKAHYPPSICARAASVWGSQNVMSIARYSAMAVDNSARACSC